MKNLFIVLIVISFIISFSCNNKSENKNPNTPNSNNNYAKGFNIQNNGKNFVLEIFNPWQNATGAKFSYQLKNRKTKTKTNEITIPLKKVICLSTTHLAFIEKLGFEKTIIGASGIKYINSKKYNKLIKEKKLIDVGYEQSLSYELIISLKPDVIFAYSVGSENTGFINKFKEFNIPVVYIADYLEEHPLGKAEWIKVFGLFYNCCDVASAMYDSIEYHYNKAKQLTKNIEYKPTVMTGLLWNETWFVPGGKSFLANFINDAGGNYIWGDNDLRRSYPISLEKVFVDSKNAEFWIHPGNANSINDILKVDKRLEKLLPLQNSNIFNNNLRENAEGGNDYWETGVVNPHIILKDLIAIFHKDILPDYELQYFKKIE